MERALLDSMSYLLVRVAKVHRGLVAQGLAELGLHTGQELVLVQLWQEDGLRNSELARRLGVAAPTVTKVLSGMERTHLLTRRADSDDARASRIWLTERGRSLREPVEQLWQAVEHTLVRDLDRSERELLARALARILHTVT
jgi:DNA-binding MarR family transcriptional regulator